MSNSFNERRKFIRIYRNFIMTYHEKGEPNAEKNVSQVNNVSKGGLSFSTDHLLNKGIVLVIGLKTPFIADPIHVDGVVLECREKVAGMIYEVRVQFQEVSDDVLDVLDKIETYGKTKEDQL